MASLIDTNFLLAAIFPNDPNHQKAAKAIQSLNVTDCIVPLPVLQELFYMTTVRINYGTAIDYCERIHEAGFEIQPTVGDDFNHIFEIMRQYSSASFDFTDVAIMALAERLKITQIYTFDRRDFLIYRPTHCEYLE
ncbi:MAG: PIN domain-containing protein, partial [Chloroflexota bacterium]